MNELVLAILTDNIELYRREFNGEPLEVVGIAMQMLFESLIGEADIGEIRGILYDIATAALLAVEETYTEE